MPSQLELLETKIQKVVESLHALRKDNERLRSECETLKSQMTLTSNEGRKAQRVLAEYDQLKRNQEQAAARVERALNKLNAMRVA
jgi:predicted RNase H-like nuclease (RuvC/YqgF family)